MLYQSRLGSEWVSTKMIDRRDDSRILLSAANNGALRALGRTPIIALNLGERNLWMSFLVVENLD